VSPPLSEVEKLAGADSETDRSKLLLKRLGILRKYIYDSLYSGNIPRWDGVLTCIDKVYVQEYSIGDSNGHVYKVLKDWEM
jgi:hypothetical protein